MQPLAAGGLAKADQAKLIEPGADFGEVIERAVDGCAVLLAVIGPSWLSAADERGGRRLDDADDMVRLEIGAALVGARPEVVVAGIAGVVHLAPGGPHGLLRAGLGAPERYPA